MKVAFVNKYFYIKGGSEKVMFEEADILRANGHLVEFFSMHHPNNNKDYRYSKYFVDHVELGNLGLEYSLLKKISLARDVIYNKKAEILFESFLQDFKPDIVHCHNISSQISFSVIKSAKKYKIPVVMTMHDYNLICPNYLLLDTSKNICQYNGYLKGNYINCILNKCVKDSLPASILASSKLIYHNSLDFYNKYIDILISPSEFLKQQVAQATFSKNKIVCLPNFINIENYIPNYSNNDYFLFVGRLSEEKGIECLLKTFAMLPDKHLKIVGNGPMYDEYSCYIKDKNLDNIELLGYKSGEELKTYYSNCKALIIPSTCYENAPMTIIEAFSYGKPVIGSDLGGIPEMIDDNINGLIFESSNADHLKEKLIIIDSNNKVIKQMGINAREKAENFYNPQAHYLKLTEIYESLLITERCKQTCD